MRKNTARLVVLAVIVMMVLNGVLIAMLWTKSSPQLRSRPSISQVNEFIIQEMGFDKETAQKFLVIANEHHKKQIQHQLHYYEIKRLLNRAMIAQEHEKVEMLIDELSIAVKAKEFELYRFISEVSTITTEEQKRKFGRIFREATGAPEYERIPMDGNSNRPHPPRP